MLGIHKIDIITLYGKLGLPYFDKTEEDVADEQWAKIHNLKQAAKTLNFLTEHGISEYEQLQAARNGFLSLHFKPSFATFRQKVQNF